MRRSVLVKVPSFSRLGAAGSTTSANWHVLLKKMSCTTKKSSFSNAALHVVRVRIDDAHLLADEVHRLELALVDRVHHLVVVEPLGRSAA